MSKRHRTAMVGNTILWVAALVAAGVVLRGTNQAGIMLAILVVLGGTSQYLVAGALRSE